MIVGIERSVIVYVRLLGEGTEVYRPVHARPLEEERLQLLASDDYDPEDEEWEFKPGSVVRIEQRELGGETVSVAVAAARMVSAAFEALKSAVLVNAGVLAVGLERGWISLVDVSTYAVEQLVGGDDRDELVEIAAADVRDSTAIAELLQEWANDEMRTSPAPGQSERRWMFGFLRAIADSDASPEEKLDRLEEAYADLGYPEEMQECSRYYVPDRDRARGIGVGESTASRLDAVAKLLVRLSAELCPH